MKDRMLWKHLAVGCVLLAGCGGGEDGPATVPVTGEVTLDGQPVETGRILFREVGGDQRAFSAAIEDGEYELQAEPGNMQVEITASRLIPGKYDTSNGAPEPVGEMYIPAKYNRKTTLTAEIVPGDPNAIPFALKSE